ncbi:SigE family RNA polymerase sigma factor [Streptacidiphilus sp. EB129]|uniref:SigE family RNA polymerase sigma factor n=1 Tax=Streptacidiphilus sp. EB129 TaxID=3156262 RepID=UPI0035191B6C
MRAAETAEFAEFVHSRSAALFRTGLLLTGSREVADDLVQSTLERVWRHWGRVARADSPEAYARRVLVNLANDRWRGQRGGTEVPLEQAGAHDRGVDPYRQVVQRDELMRALHLLPVRMRTVLVLRYYDDMSDEGIADLLRISASTVRSQAVRGLAKLREVVRGAEDVRGAEGRVAGSERAG